MKTVAVVKTLTEKGYKETGRIVKEGNSLIGTSLQARILLDNNKGSSLEDMVSKYRGDYVKVELL